MTDADSTDKNAPLTSGKSVSDAEETSVMKVSNDGNGSNDTNGTNDADAPNSKPTGPTENPESQEESEEEKPKSGFRKFFGIMPFWAWVLTLGLIATIIVAIGAYTSMRSTETGTPGSISNTEQLKRSYPKPTTSGKYDDDDTKPTPDAGSGYGSGYGNGYQDYGYTPQEPQQTEATSTESETEKPSTSPKPSTPSRGGDNRPSPRGNRGNNSSSPRPRVGGAVGGNTGGGTGNGNSSPNTGAGDTGTDSDSDAGVAEE